MEEKRDVEASEEVTTGVQEWGASGLDQLRRKEVVAGSWVYIKVNPDFFVLFPFSYGFSLWFQSFTGDILYHLKFTRRTATWPAWQNIKRMFPWSTDSLIYVFTAI